MPRFLACLVNSLLNPIPNLELDDVEDNDDLYINYESEEKFYLEIEDTKISFDIAQTEFYKVFYKAFSSKFSEIRIKGYFPSNSLKVNNLKITSKSQSVPVTSVVLHQGTTSETFWPGDYVIVHTVPLEQLDFNSVSNYVVDSYYDFMDSPSSATMEDYRSDVESFYHAVTHSKLEHLKYLAGILTSDLFRLITNEIVSITIDSHGINTIVLENQEGANFD